MKKILLIEDNRDVRENIVEILELAAYKVFAAENGKVGVELAIKELPDLIICDIMMPELDGYGVLHLLNKNNATSGIPFIFLTAKVEKDDIRKGMSLGADDYLTKPFDDVELLDAIEIRLKKNEIIKEEFKKTAEGLNDFLTQAKGIKELDILLSNEKRVTSIPKKHIIFSQGSYPNFLYFINKGKIKTFKIYKLGNEFITGLYKDGDFFGYTDLLGNSEYAEGAVSLEDSEICMIPKDDFYSLVYKNAEVSRKFIKMLSDNLQEKEEQLIKLAYNSVRKRVAESLVTLYDRYKKEDEQKFSMNISREDLANLAGTATETTIRTLRDFKEDGNEKWESFKVEFKRDMDNLGEALGDLTKNNTK